MKRWLQAALLCGIVCSSACSSGDSDASRGSEKLSEVFVDIFGFGDARTGAVLIDREGRRTSWNVVGLYRQIGRGHPGRERPRRHDGRNFCGYGGRGAGVNADVPLLHDPGLGGCARTAQ